VPESVEDEGHVDPLPAEVHFGPLSATGDLVPMWDHEEATCSNIYCHGGNLSGGEDTQPVWTRVDGTQTRCGSCHGYPPPLPHPPANDCERCHSDTVGPFGDIRTELRQHIDGDVDVDRLSCTACHGGGDSPAPPFDLSGESSTTARGVGAHRSHLAESAWHGPVACAECHTVPAAYEDEGHVDDDPPEAELVWGDLASKAGAQPSFDGTGCSNVYCHGGTLSGGSNTTPAWTVVDGSQAACGTCHGLPPAPPHPQNPRCADCHSEVMAAANDFAAPTLHIDGQVQVDDNGCASCHGEDGNPAPPRDTQGNTSPTERGVGFHATHTRSAPRWVPIECDECHLVPTAVDSPGHVDTPTPAEVVFGELASAGGVTATFDGLNCTTYCHGVSLDAGGTLTTPQWTDTGHKQAYCGTCHAAPPPAPHPDATLLTCGDCHPANTPYPDPEKHINGVVDFGSSP
jgi:predicted CxxxxCH...CXXCH cytochrome family protein